MRPRSLLSVLVVPVLVFASTASAGPAVAGGAMPGCASPSGGAKAIWPNASAGDWTSMGHDLSNSRSQPQETRISPSQFPPSDDPHTQDANGLQPRWTFSTSSSINGKAGPGGDFQSTVNVVDGCVYGATSTGTIFAVNEQNGRGVWFTAIPGQGAGGGIFGMTVAGGKIYALTNGPKGPFAIALDQATGRILWQSVVVDKNHGTLGSSTNASTVYFDGLVFMGFSESGGDLLAGNDGTGYFGGYAILDAATGKVLVDRNTIPPAAAKKGYAGGGVWATGAVDPTTRYLYTGTGNPYGKKEYKYTNAVVKIDLDRSRSTFGRIVDFGHGNYDQYASQLKPLASTPACTESPLPTTLEHPECGQIDLDMAAAPNMFTDSKGHQLIGALQKSGVYHAFYTDTMKQAWQTVVGEPYALGNADAGAYDGKNIYVVGSPGGVIYALNKDDGSIVWSSPVADGTHYEAISVANGVVYTIDSKGNLDTFDVATGQPDFSRPMAFDSGNTCTSLSGGVAIAQSMVFAPCGGTLIAYS